MALDRTTTDASPEARHSVIRVLLRLISGWPRRGDKAGLSPSAARDGFVR